MKLQLLSTERGMKSRSLKRLAEALSKKYGYKVFRTVTKRPNKVQLKYGGNVDKLSQYKYFQQQNICALEFTTDRATAQKWVNDGEVVFGREQLNASCGKGIKVFEAGAQCTPCPVYTKYKPKKREFRVHIFRGNVVGICEKKRKADYEGDKKDAKIRNLEHGYIFTQTVELTAGLKTKLEELSVKAAKVCNSDFAGVDVCYNEKKDEAFIIEVNSAPGIEGTNVIKYAEVIRSKIQAPA